jgi:hypothetical protein
LLLNEADKASESGGSIILPLSKSFTFGLNLPRLGDQPQNVLRFPLLLFRRRLGHDDGCLDVGGVFATFSFDADVGNDVRAEIEFDRLRRLPATSFSGVATMSMQPKGTLSLADSTSITEVSF